MHYLVAHLEGEAGNVTRHLNILGENFKIAMRILEDRYKNKEIIAEALMKRIIRMNDTINSIESPLKTLLTIKEVTTVKRKKDKIFEEIDPWLVNSISQRFSKEMKVVFNQNVKEKEKHSIRKLIKFLEHQ
jgi:molybdopterin converting factor small subunit